MSVSLLVKRQRRISVKPLTSHFLLSRGCGCVSSLIGQSESEQERAELRTKYVSLGEKLDTLLRDESHHKQHLMKDVEESKVPKCMFNTHSSHSTVA